MATFTAIPSAFNNLYGAKPKEATIDPKRFIPTENLSLLPQTPSPKDPKSTIDSSKFIRTPTVSSFAKTTPSPSEMAGSPSTIKPLTGRTPMELDVQPNASNEWYSVAPTEAPKTWTGEAWLSIKRASANFVKEIPLIPFRILGVEKAEAPTEINGQPNTNVEDAIRQMHAQGYHADADMALQDYKKKLLSSEVTGYPSELARSDQLYPPGKIETLFRDLTGALPEFAALGYLMGPSKVSTEILSNSAARKFLPKVGMDIAEEAATKLQKVGSWFAETATREAPFSVTWSAVRSKDIKEFPMNAATDYATIFPLFVAGRSGKLLVKKGANAIMELLAKAGERKIAISPQTFKEFLGGVDNDQMSQIWSELPVQTRVFFLESQLGENRLLALQGKGKKFSMGENRPAGLSKDLFGNEIPQEAPKPSAMQKDIFGNELTPEQIKANEAKAKQQEDLKTRTGEMGTAIQGGNESMAFGNTAQEGMPLAGSSAGASEPVQATISPSGSSVASRGKFATVPVESIKTDPTRFQVRKDVHPRLGFEEENVSRILASEGYKPEKVRPIEIGRFPDAKGDMQEFVMNGHNTLEILKRSGVKDASVEYLDFPNEEAAKAYALTVNNAAKLPKILEQVSQVQQLMKAGKNVEEIAVEMGRVKPSLITTYANIGELDPVIQRQVAQGIITPELGGILGKYSKEMGMDTSLQLQIAQKIQADRFTPIRLNKYLSSMGEYAKATKKVDTLFGVEDIPIGFDEIESKLTVERSRLQKLKTELAVMKRNPERLRKGELGRIKREEATAKARSEVLDYLLATGGRGEELVKPPKGMNKKLIAQIQDEVLGVRSGAVRGSPSLSPISVESPGTMKDLTTLSDNSLQDSPSNLSTDTGRSPGGSVASSTRYVSPSQSYSRNAISNKEYIAQTMKLSKENYPIFKQDMEEVTGLSLIETSGVKPESSLKTKVEAAKLAGKDPRETISDSMRGTVLANTPEEASSIAQTLPEKLSEKGITILKMEDSFANPRSDGYRGVNIQVELPNGQRAELQIHTDLSLRVKEWGHETRYEKYRRADISKMSPQELADMEAWNKESAKLYNEHFENGGKDLPPKEHYFETYRKNLEAAQNPPPPPPKTPRTAPELPPDQNIVQNLTQALKEAKSLRGKQEQIYSEERSLRLARAMSVGERVSGEKGFYAQLGQLKGEYTKVEFESLRQKIPQEQIDRLFGMVEQNKDISGFQKITAKSGLLKMFGEKGGAVPTNGELMLLGKVFPKEMIDALLGKRTLFQKFKEAGLQILNTPRTIMASFDLSYGLRQGVFAAPRYRKEFFSSFKKQFSWFKSEEAFKASQEAIAKNKWYDLAVEGELSFTEMDGLMGAREEAFMGQWAEKIPLAGRMIRASGRAYTGFANKFRMDIFAKLMEDAEKLGLDPSKNMDFVMKTADFVNTATGRGKLPMGLERAGPVLNAMFFSPRLMFSRLDLLGANPLDPIKFLRATPFVRKEYLKSLFTFAGTMMTVLGVAKLGGADVVSDPRSSDFGKIKIGNTRFDIMGGFQQYIRMVAQLTTGKYISSTTGKEYTLGEGYKPLTRYDILMRQVESKESPVLSFITDILRQQDYAGQPVSVVKEIANRFYPMMISGLVDVAKDDPKLLPLSMLSIFGVGMQTYQPTKNAGNDIFRQNARVNTSATRTNVRINPYR
jgi:ppGpp synthetase/RelA/SpoT-type nucleotidyltranferase